MTGEYAGQVVRVVAVILSPFIMLFGLYVIAHGHYGPGGGFAGGVVLAVGVVLLRLTGDEEAVHRRFPTWIGLGAGSAGVLLLLLLGLAPLLAGGALLDYGSLAPAGVDPPDARYLGILVLEVAVGLAVFGTMLLIFDVIAGRLGDEEHDDA